jgi:hypothetical protein
MNPQTPAEGILLRKDWGDAKSYVVECECGCEQHTHHVWVEADEGGVSVRTYVELKTDFWTQAVEPKYDIDNDMLQWYNWFWTGLWNSLCTRLRLTKEIWFNGYAKYEGTICMSRQQATNYAETLINAVADVTEFRKKM